MNQETKELKSFFLKRFAGTNDHIFDMAIKLALTSLESAETSNDLQPATALKLKIYFSQLSDDELRDLLYAGLANKPL